MSATVQYYTERSFIAFFPFFITTDMSAIATGEGYRTEYTSSALGDRDGDETRASAHLLLLDSHETADEGHDLQSTRSVR